MALTDVMMQKLERSQYNGDIQILSRSQANAVDGPIYSIFEQARNAFLRNANKQVGTFDSAGEHQQIMALIMNWQQEQIDFAGLSKRLISLLQQQLLPSEEPFTGIIISAIETIAEQQYLSIFWLSEVDVISYTADLEPLSSRMIAAEKVQYGLRLQLDDWQSEEPSTTYLHSLCSRGNKAFSEAFLRFSNFSQRIDNQKQTEDFLQLVENYSQTLEDEQSRPMRSAILDYCIAQDKIGQPIEIEQLSEHINEKEPQHFAQYAEQQNSNDTVYTHRQSLKRYMRYFGRDSSLSISFSAERMEQDIIYDPMSSSLTIKKLPKSLKQQLTGFGSSNADS